MNRKIPFNYAPGARLVATSVMSSSSAMSDHNDSNFVTSYTPLLRMPSKCINKCGKQVNQAGNTCGTCMKAMKAAMMASGTENCNINIVNRPSGYYCSNDCGSRKAYKSDVCLTCAKAQGLLSGDISGKTKAFNAIRRDTDIAAVAEYKRLHADVDNSIGAQAKAVAVAKSEFADLISAIQTGNPERIIMASIFVASKGCGHSVIHEGRESSLSQLRGKVDRKNSIVKLVDRDGVTYWRNLDSKERMCIGCDLW